MRLTSTWLERLGKRLHKMCLAGVIVSAAAPASAQIQLPSPPTTGQPPVVGQPLNPGLAGSEKQSVRLQAYNVPAEFVGSVGAQLQLRFHNNPQVRITTEPRTGQLMVMAPEAVQLQVGQLLSKFLANIQQSAKQNARPGVASTEQQEYRLRNLSWRELEDALTRLGGAKLTLNTERNGEVAVLRIANQAGLEDVMQIDRRLNQVTILGTGPSVIGWAQVVYSLDQGQAEAGVETHVVPLEPAEPRRVRAAVQLVKTAVLQDQAGQNAEARVQVGDDERVMAADSLDNLSTESGLFGDVQIEFVDDIGLVIIRGSKRDVQRTLQVIEDIKKRAAETQPEIELMPLAHANSQAVADLVTELYANIYEPRQGPVSITALGQPNSLLLIGRKEVVQSVVELVKKIDQPLDPDNQLKVIRLLNASAVDVEARIRGFFVEKPGSDDEDRVALGTRVKILADFRTNSLIVQASPREMVEVEKLVGELDVESTSAQNDVKVFRLKNTLAEELVSVLQEVIGGEPNTGESSDATPLSGKLSIVTRDGERVESGILAGIVISPDPSVNAVVVRAPAQSMALIEKLINELDQLPSAEAKIKVYPLQEGDATSLAQLLQQLFGLQVTAGQSASANAFNSLTTLTTGGEGALVQLQIAPDARTNTIIVSGAESDLEVIEALLYRLDEEVPEGRRSEVIWLRNAFSDDVTAAIQSYVQQIVQGQQSLISGTAQVISPSEFVDRQIYVVSEPTTNSILISAVPRYFDQIVALIERLDRRPPLVAIQVMIAEVRLDDQFELGAEWGIQDGLLFDRQSATGGTLSSPGFNILNPLTGPSSAITTGQPQNLAGQALSSFAMGRANADGLGGLVLSASSEAVSVLVRALQSANRLQILSRPQITTLDQREASVLIGQQVPRVNGITAGGLGVGQTISTTDIPVGLSLNVLPRVNQDGLILMQVNLINSSVQDADSGIPVGFGPNGEVIRSPIIDSTEAATTVTAYSGQTVVFAGLISKRRGSIRRQIPVLGSLPVIGAAFRFDTETETRSELLVVLTPTPDLLRRRL